MKILNKAEVTAGKKQGATKLSPEDVGKWALLPGDPDRVLRVGKYLEGAREIAFSREFRTVTGTYKGIHITATSTGIGCPSASIAIENLANIGVTHFIRIGSTAALKPEMKRGDIVINTAAMRNEGTTKFYVRDAFPAAADHFLVHALIETALEYREERGFNLHVGLNACDDAFFGETPEWIEMLVEHKLTNIEMESAAIFTIAHLRGLKAAMIAAVSANLVTSDFDYTGENEPLVQGWENEIEIALESIVRYEEDSLAHKL
jgi:uridine phosphorylase